MTPGLFCMFGVYSGRPIGSVDRHRSAARTSRAAGPLLRAQPQQHPGPLAPGDRPPHFRPGDRLGRAGAHLRPRRRAGADPRSAGAGGGVHRTVVAPPAGCTERVRAAAGRRAQTAGHRCSITAESPARLRQIPSEVFGELLATEPTLHAAGQSAVCERIPVSEDSLSSSTQSTRGCAAYSARPEPLAAS